MINEELLTVVNEIYYQQKKSRDEVKKVLLSRGWKEEDIKDEDIDKAIIHIRNQALRKLPVVSLIYKFLDQLENKYAHLSTRAIVIVLIVAICWLFLVAFAVYLIYDPLTVTKKDTAAPSSVVLPQEGTELSFP
jgi:hypothetical protein